MFDRELVHSPYTGGVAGLHDVMVWRRRLTQSARPRVESSVVYLQTVFDSTQIHSFKAISWFQACLFIQPRALLYVTEAALLKAEGRSDGGHAGGQGLERHRIGITLVKFTKELT